MCCCGRVLYGPVGFRREYSCVLCCCGDVKLSFVMHMGKGTVDSSFGGVVYRLVKCCNGDVGVMSGRVLFCVGIVM